MYSHYGMYHPMQRIVDKLFIPDKDEDGLLTLADSISVNFKEK